MALREGRTFPGVAAGAGGELGGVRGGVVVVVVVGTGALGSTTVTRRANAASMCRRYTFVPVYSVSSGSPS